VPFLALLMLYGINDRECESGLRDEGRQECFITPEQRVDYLPRRCLGVKRGKKNWHKISILTSSTALPTFIEFITISFFLLALSSFFTFLRTRGISIISFLNLESKKL
jgi:hypothetical protein